MIHYSCDLCGRSLQPDKDVRYVIKVEVYSVYEEDDAFDEHEDHDDEIDEEMEELEDAEYKTFRFDLCCECHSKCLQNPLFTKGSRKTRFSEN